MENTSLPISYVQYSFITLQQSVPWQTSYNNVSFLLFLQFHGLSSLRVRKFQIQVTRNAEVYLSAHFSEFLNINRMFS